MGIKLQAILRKYEKTIFEKNGQFIEKSIIDLAKGVANDKRKIWFLVFFQEMTNEVKS